MTYYKIHRFLKILLLILFLLLGVKNAFAFTSTGEGATRTLITYSNTSTAEHVACGNGPASFDNYSSNGSSGDCHTYFGEWGLQFVNFRDRGVVTHSNCGSDGNYNIYNYTEKSITCRDMCSIEISDTFSEVKGNFEHCEQKMLDLGYDSTNAACGCPTVTDPVTKQNLYVNPDFNSTGCPVGQAKDVYGVCQTDTDGDGTPDVEENGDVCIGEDVNSIIYTPHLGYLKSDYTSLSPSNFVVEGKCLEALDIDIVDSVMVVSDLESLCDYEYCYIHTIDLNCEDLDYNNYFPSTHWVYKPGLSKSSCEDLVDGITISESSYVVPDSVNCATTGFCFALPFSSDNNTTDGSSDNNTSESTDENNTSLDSNITQPDLNITNSLLDDLLNLSNDNNKSNKTRNDLLSDINSTIKESVGFLGDMNGSLNSIKGLLDDLNSSFSDKAKGKGLLRAIDDANTSFGFILSEYNRFKDTYETQFTRVKSDFENLSNVFDTSRTFTIGGATDSSCFTVNVWGQTLNFNPCPYLSRFAPLFTLFISIFFSIAVITIILRSMENH